MQSPLFYTNYLAKKLIISGKLPVSLPFYSVAEAFIILSAFSYSLHKRISDA